MNKITSVGGEPKQQMFVTIDGYDKAKLYLEWKPLQNYWFFSLTWGTFSVNNHRVVIGYNLLRQYHRQIPFGLLVDSADGQDPMTDDAFVTTCSIYLLTADDVTAIETNIYGQ